MSIIGAILGDVTWKQLDIQNATGWDGSFGAVQAYTGESVTPDSAMRVATYYACISMIAETIGLLPFNVYKRNRSTGSSKIDFEHPVQRLIHAEPNDEMSSETYRSTCTSHYLGGGNSYSEIEFNGAGDPIGLYPIHNSRVEVARRNNGELYYRIHMTDKADPKQWGGKILEVPKENILHLKALSTDGITGMSVARLAAQSLGVSMAAQRYGASYFRNASRPSGIISHPDNVALSPEAKAELRQSWQSVYGGADNVGRVVVLEGGGKYQSIKIDPNEAQFIETMDHTDLEICRWFRMPPWKVGIQDQAKGWGTLEATNTQFVQDCLAIHATRWESEVNRKLLGGYDSDYYSKIEFNGLLRGDLKTRQTWYEAMTRIGVYSINEVRQLEDYEGIGPDGDKHTVQLNLTTIDKVGEDIEPEPEDAQPNPFGRSQPMDEQETEDEEEDSSEDVAAILRPVVIDAAHRLIKKRENELDRLSKKHKQDKQAFIDAAIEFQVAEDANARDVFAPIASAARLYPGEMEFYTEKMGSAAVDAIRTRASSHEWQSLSAEERYSEATIYANAILAMLENRKG